MEMEYHPAVCTECCKRMALYEPEEPCHSDVREIASQLGYVLRELIGQLLALCAAASAVVMVGIPSLILSKKKLGPRAHDKLQSIKQEQQRVYDFEQQHRQQIDALLHQIMIDQQLVRDTERAVAQASYNGDETELEIVLHYHNKIVAQAEGRISEANLLIDHLKTEWHQLETLRLQIEYPDCRDNDDY